MLWLPIGFGITLSGDSVSNEAQQARGSPEPWITIANVVGLARRQHGVDP